MKKLVSTVFVLLVSSFIYATEIPTIVADKLEITSVYNMTTDQMSNIKVTINTEESDENHDPKSITFSYFDKEFNEDVSITVPVTENVLLSTTHGPGTSVVVNKSRYVGYLQTENYVRTSITIDETAVFGCFTRNRTWKVHIRRGFGWCGTGDQVINLEGRVAFN